MDGKFVRSAISRRVFNLTLTRQGVLPVLAQRPKLSPRDLDQDCVETGRCYIRNRVETSSRMQARNS